MWYFKHVWAKGNLARQYGGQDARPVHVIQSMKNTGQYADLALVGTQNVWAKIGNWLTANTLNQERISAFRLNYKLVVCFWSWPLDTVLDEETIQLLTIQLPAKMYITLVNNCLHVNQWKIFIWNTFVQRVTKDLHSPRNSVVCQTFTQKMNYHFNVGKIMQVTRVFYKSLSQWRPLKLAWSHLWFSECYCAFDEIKKMENYIDGVQKLS